MRGGCGTRGGFLCGGCFFFVSMIALCERERGTCVEERGHPWKETDRCGNRWKDRKVGDMASLLFYLYSCLYH